MSKQIKKEKKGLIYFIKESNHFNTLSINPTKWSNTLKVPQKGPKKFLIEVSNGSNEHIQERFNSFN